MLAVTGCTHRFSLSRLFICLLACIGRPEASISLLDQQRDFFNEKKMEVEAARRFVVVPDKKNEVGNENQDDNSEEARLLDVESEWVEEMDGNKEKQANAEEVQNEVEEEMDDDVGRKDSLYDAEEDDGKVTHSTVEFFLFIAVIVGFVGFVVTWYTRKFKRKRSGLHKNR
jgi:hypothetical protein